MSKLFVLGISGATGTLCRYWLDGWTYKFAGDGFPYGTLAVNILGCFLIGFMGLVIGVVLARVIL